MISKLCRFGLPLALQNFLIGASGTMYQAAVNVQGFGNSVYSMISGILEAVTRVVAARLGMVLASTELLFLTEPLSWTSGAVFILGAFFVVQKKTK